MKFTKGNFYSLKAVAFVTPLIFSPALIAKVAEKIDESTLLGEVRVEAKIDKKENEVTGLGKIVKNSQTLNREQVNGIRDLTRYNPGVYATEQGQGGSAGYTIHGVDKNRVTILVDGIPQIQSHTNAQYGGELHQRTKNMGSGAINEIEFENISAVEINKGGNSVESGNGALGGSVNFTTKNVDDVLLADRHFGGSAKSVYSSKDQQFMKSLAGAFRDNGFEGLLQFTHRKGKETRAHKDAENATQQFTRIGWFAWKYDFKSETPNTLDEPYWVNGEPHNFVEATRGVDRTAEPHRTGREWSAEEREQGKSMLHWRETVSAQDFTGPERMLPDPKQYDSAAWLARLGYHFNDKHYIGFTLEDTKQTYASRDMLQPAYYLPYENKRSELSGNHYYITHPMEGALEGGAWSRTHFTDEKHRKQRTGLNYIFSGESKWVDRFELNLDNQKIKLMSLDLRLNCSLYPSADKNCRAGSDKPDSTQQIYDAKFVEKHQRVGIKYNKFFDVSFTQHNFQVVAGFDKYKASQDDHFDKVTYTHNNKKTLENGREVYTYYPASVFLNDRKDLCNLIFPKYHESDKEMKLPNIQYCNNLIFSGHNYYLGVRDNITLGKYVDLGLGVRYDLTTLKGNKSFLDEIKYKNISWNTGVVFKPFEFLDVSYRASTGFRNPSYAEFFDDNWQDNPSLSKRSEIKPEKSLNQEVGITFKGDWGALETSYFVTKYRGLISAARKTNKHAEYYNFSDVDIQGMNILGLFDLNAIWHKIPDGFTLNVGYSYAKPKSVRRTNEELTGGNLYSLDAIQPPKTVVGLNFDAPSKKWGLSAIMTHSKEKNPDEIRYTEYGVFNYRVLDEQGRRTGKWVMKGEEQRKSNSEGSKSWTTWDLIGYVNLPYHITLRAGIYNVFNKRYSSWESIRQSSSGAIHRHYIQRGGSDTTFARYTAPGRNYSLNFEMKF